MKYWAMRFRALRGGRWVKASRLVSMDAKVDAQLVMERALEACVARGELLDEVREVIATR